MFATLRRCNEGRVVGSSPLHVVDDEAARQQVIIQANIGNGDDELVNAVQYMGDRESHVSTVIAIGPRPLQGAFQVIYIFLRGHRLQHQHPA